MYPYLRLARVVLTEARKPRQSVLDVHHLPMRCLPRDNDLFVEMNNGRILTLFDLGRFAMSVRVGLSEVLRRERWGLVVAGSSVRYRVRIRPFQAYEIRTELMGWDDRFFYFQQGMWRGETCHNHALVRTGVTERGRLVASDRVAAAMGVDATSPDLPGWARGWVETDATRPWPPVMRGA